MGTVEFYFDLHTKSRERNLNQELILAGLQLVDEGRKTAVDVGYYVENSRKRIGVVASGNQNDIKNLTERFRKHNVLILGSKDYSITTPQKYDGKFDPKYNLLVNAMRASYVRTDIMTDVAKLLERLADRIA